MDVVGGNNLPDCPYRMELVTKSCLKMREATWEKVSVKICFNTDK